MMIHAQTKGVSMRLPVFSSHPRCPADGNLGASWLEGRQVAQATLHLFDACRGLKGDEGGGGLLG